MVKKRLTNRLRVPAFDVATIGRHYFSIGRQNNLECMMEPTRPFDQKTFVVAPSLFLIASFMRMVGGIALWKSTHASRSFCRGHRWIADGGSSLINLILKPRMKSRGFQPKPRKAGAGSNTISFAIRVPMAALASTQIGGPFWGKLGVSDALGSPFGLTRVDRWTYLTLRLHASLPDLSGLS